MLKQRKFKKFHEKAQHKKKRERERERETR
jgi:hypothetical protein